MEVSDLISKKNGKRATAMNRAGEDDKVGVGWGGGGRLAELVEVGGAVAQW